MAVALAVICNYNSAYMYFGRLEFGINIFSEFWDAVIANERIGKNKYLARIWGVCECFGIAGHTGIEHHFPFGIAEIAEWAARKNPAIF